MVINKSNFRKTGNILAGVRNGESIKQTALAKKMKKAQAFISTVETSGKVPSFETIVQYLHNCGYSIQIVKSKTA